MTTEGRHPAGTAITRHLHLVDIENLGVETSGGRVLRGTGEVYRAVAVPGRLDQFIVGADATRIFDAAREFPGVRQCAGWGPDGGEDAILAEVNLELVSQRFDAITIGSGDSRFCDLAQSARAKGIPIRVISRPDRLSHQLRQLTQWFIWFPDPVLWGHHRGVGSKGRTAA